MVGGSEAQLVSPVARAGRGTRGKGRSSPVFSFLQLTSGPSQEKLPPLALLKWVNQVQPGGAGEEWAGPEGGGPISRGGGGVTRAVPPAGSQVCDGLGGSEGGIQERNRS